jgi:hypothetical protein
MTSEKKARQEVEEMRQTMKKMQEAERRDRRKLAEDEALRKIKKMEETIAELQKSLQSQKQREEALLNDLEVTGQAFEDMQEQNLRLLQQLREKDDANFKLMSEVSLGKEHFTLSFSLSFVFFAMLSFGSPTSNSCPRSGGTLSFSLPFPCSPCSFQLQTPVRGQE